MRSPFQSLGVFGAALLVALSAGTIGGCHTAPPDRVANPAPEHYGKLNAAMVQVLNRSSIDAAILEQHTLYPYHFVRHSTELNDLGRRDLAVLLTHYKEFAHAGTVQSLNVRRADTPETLYDARIRRVAQLIADAGIASNRIEVADGMPGGDGAQTERAIRILETELDAVTDGRELKARDRSGSIRIGGGSGGSGR